MYVVVRVKPTFGQLAPLGSAAKLLDTGKEQIASLARTSIKCQRRYGVLYGSRMHDSLAVSHLFLVIFACELL
jgi:hypothetical protein